MPLPNTILANSYKALKASEEEKIDTTIKYDEAYTEFNRWLCLHVRHLKSVSNEEHPHALNMQALLKHLQESPPRTAFSPEIFGYYSWAELLDVLDDDGNGYITTSDFSSFWDKVIILHLNLICLDELYVLTEVTFVSPHLLIARGSYSPFGQ